MNRRAREATTLPQHSKESTRRKHGYSSDNYRNGLIGTLTRLRVVVFPINPITHTGTHTDTNTNAGAHTIANTITDTIASTNTVANAGSSRIHRQGRTHDDHNGLRPKPRYGRCRGYGDVDEQRHHHAHVDRRRQHMGLR
jgi:hypothetical protein